jgi:hypothetical protein
LHVLNGQNYTTNTASNAIGNAGLVELGGGTFTDASFNNTGSLSGFGRLTSTAGNPLANSGQVTATGGNLILAQGVTGATGGITIANAASLDVSGATGGNSVGTLLHNGANLNLGTRNITVSTDYNNANFGSGNSFNNHANVTGTGSILAAGTGLSLTVSGPGVTGGGTASPTLALGNVHVGSPLGGSFSIDWAGTNAPALRGAVTSTSGLTVSAPGWGPIAPGGSQAETVTVAAGAAGSLSGQTLGVLTNFDNVAAKTISVTGAAYDLANPVITAPPQPIAFGNHHVGDAITQQAVTIQNQVVTSAAFQEGLDVTATPGAGRTATGSIGLLAAGKSSSAISVGIDSASAGNKSGNVALTLTSNGSGTSGLGTTPLPSQNVAVTGAIYNFATSNAIAPLHFVQHVGDGGGSVSQALIITNTAPAGAFSEGLNSGFGAYTPGVTDTLTPTFKGSITNLAAGATDSTSMLATIDTTKAGLFNGSTVVQQASNGATTSGLGITKLADQNVGVSGSVTGGVFVLASPQINNPPPGSPAIAFGNVRIGSSVANQAISVSNTASGPSGLVEALDANVILPPPAGITASGSFSGLAPGATDNSSLLVGLDTSTAGAHGGNLGVHFVSNGTGVSGDGTTTDLGSQNVAVSGSVYRLANPTLNTTSSSLAARVGDASPTSAISVTNTSPDTFTESLKASVTAFPSGFSNSGGTIGGLTAGSTDATTMRVGLNTGTSGVFSGNATVGFVSTGSGTDGAPDVPAGSASVALTGKVYQAAAASVSPSVNFGIVHVGDVVANKSINVANTASGNLVDSVTGSISTVSGPFTNGGGSLGSGVTAGSNSNALTVGLNTSKAGVFAGGTAGSATLALASHDNDLTDLSLGTTAVALSGQVNNFAVAAFGKTGGAGVLSGGGTSYVLNLGSFVQGSGAVNTSLFATNATTGPADLLDGSFSIFSGSGYLLSGFNPFVDLAAGIQDVGLDVTFDPTTQGLFSETIDLAGIGHNASGFSGALPDTFLTITASVGGTAGVPEPPSWAVLLAGLVGLGAAARRRMDGR